MLPIEKDSSPGTEWKGFFSALLLIYLLALTGAVVWLSLESVQHRQLINELRDNQRQCADTNKEFRVKTSTSPSNQEQSRQVERKQTEDSVKREILSEGSSTILDLLTKVDTKAGPPGLPGIQGPPGRNGRDAVFDYDAVDKHINLTVKEAVGEAMSKLRLAVKELPTIGGAVYTRWGKSSCPSSSSLVMKGRMGGTTYTDRGGSSQYICLPDDPEYAKYDGAGASSISGVEYNSASSKLFGKSLHNRNAPCTMCQTQSRATQVMFPAIVRCPDSSWTFEYQGYLMTSVGSNKRKYTHYRTEYVCVDQNAEWISGMAGSSAEGALLVHTSAGDLGYCPPYYPDRQLACVVCSK